jgi:hypothetical protein
MKKKSKSLAVSFSVVDEDELERLILTYSPKFQVILNKSKKEIQETGGIRHEDFWREVEAEAQQRSNS